MSCADFELMIALDAGGDLPAANGERLARHLPTCAECRRFADEMRDSQRAVALLAGAPLDQKVLAAVRAGVLREIERSGERTMVPFPRRGAGLGRLPSRVLALAAALVAALGALLLLRSGGFGAGPREEPAPGPRVAEVPAAEPSATPPPVDPTPIALTPRPTAEEMPAPAAVTADRVAADRPAAEDPIEETTHESPKPGPRDTVSLAIQSATPPAAVAAITTATEPPAEPMVIKLVSEEADVVIYWLVQPAPTLSPGRGRTVSPSGAPNESPFGGPNVETKDEISTV